MNILKVDLPNAAITLSGVDLKSYDDITLDY